MLFDGGLVDRPHIRRPSYSYFIKNHTTNVKR